MKILNFIQKWRKRYIHPLPVVSTPYIQSLKKTQRQYFWALVLLSLCLGYYSYHWVQQKALAQAPTPAIVSTKPLSMGHKIEDSDAQLLSLPRQHVPKTAIKDLNSIVGKTLVQSVAQGEILVDIDLSAKQSPDSITAKFKTDFAFSISEEWLVAPLPSLAPGDRVDVLVTNPSDTKTLSVNVASNLEVIAIETNRNRKNLILRVDPNQAQALLSSRGLRLPMQILVQSSSTF